MTDALIIRGATVGRDADGYFNLTDIWRAAGADEAKNPNKWRTFVYVKELSGALAENPLFKGVIANTRSKSVAYSKTGRCGGTFAHYILAIAYAEYLNPDIGIEVREIATRVWGGDASVLDDYNPAWWRRWKRTSYVCTIALR